MRPRREIFYSKSCQILKYLPKMSKFDIKEAWDILDDIFNLEKQRRWDIFGN